MRVGCLTRGVVCPLDSWSEFFDFVRVFLRNDKTESLLVFKSIFEFCGERCRRRFKFAKKP